jgi:hypothetical protein
MVGYGPLCVIQKESLCPSIGDINGPIIDKWKYMHKTNGSSGGVRSYYVGRVWRGSGLIPCHQIMLKREAIIWKKTYGSELMISHQSAKYEFASSNTTRTTFSFDACLN